MAAVEMMATIDAQQRLKLEGVLPVVGPVRVRILVLYPDTGSDTQGEWSEDVWLRAAARNPAFAFLNDPAEDIYSLADGEPFSDEI